MKSTFAPSGLFLIFSQKPLLFHPPLHTHTHTHTHTHITRIDYRNTITANVSSIAPKRYQLIKHDQTLQQCLTSSLPLLYLSFFHLGGRRRSTSGCSLFNHPTICPTSPPQLLSSQQHFCNHKELWKDVDANKLNRLSIQHRSTPELDWMVSADICGQISSDQIVNINWRSQCVVFVAIN